jgi:hypothetical protein
MLQGLVKEIGQLVERSVKVEIAKWMTPTQINRMIQEMAVAISEAIDEAQLEDDVADQLVENIERRWLRIAQDATGAVDAEAER